MSNKVMSSLLSKFEDESRSERVVFNELGELFREQEKQKAIQQIDDIIAKSILVLIFNRHYRILLK